MEWLGVVIAIVGVAVSFGLLGISQQLAGIRDLLAEILKTMRVR